MHAFGFAQFVRLSFLLDFLTSVIYIFILQCSVPLEILFLSYCWHLTLLCIVVLLVLYFSISLFLSFSCCSKKTSMKYVMLALKRNWIRKSYQGSEFVQFRSYTALSVKWNALDTDTNTHTHIKCCIPLGIEKRIHYYTYMYRKRKKQTIQPRWNDFKSTYQNMVLCRKTPSHWPSDWHSSHSFVWCPGNGLISNRMIAWIPIFKPKKKRQNGRKKNPDDKSMCLKFNAKLKHTDKNIWEQFATWLHMIWKETDCDDQS